MPPDLAIQQVVAYAFAALLIPSGALLLGFGLRPDLFRPALARAARATGHQRRTAARIAQQRRAGERVAQQEFIDPPAPAEPTPNPVTTPSTLPPVHAIRRLVSGSHRSTAQERYDCRTRLGVGFDRHLQAVSELVADRPAELRGMLTTEQNTVAAEDLATVRAYLQGDLPDLDRALRTGTAEPDRALVACLVSGLLRLPTHHGASYAATTTISDVPLDAYRAGSILIEPTFVRTNVEWSLNPKAAEMKNLVTYAIWSYSGRQVTLLDGEADSVTFAAGTSFLVLDVEQSRDGSGSSVVFLAERRGQATPASGEREQRILEHLRRKLAIRSAQPRPGVAPGSGVDDNWDDWPGELGFALGLDDDGRPFQEETDRPSASSGRVDL